MSEIQWPWAWFKFKLAVNTALVLVPLVVAARMGHPKDNLGASNNGWRVEGASLSLSISMRLFLTTLEKINFGHCLLYILRDPGVTTFQCPLA